ncbi:DUF1003 domain-containing protein [Caproiciproducens sp. NJN-50]|uniref:DUF1003 domain-containing protein n=1 Tax=Acutalibacteraceae TaxID=3082771 RepID=UPI000FFE0662|nr:MULTISPECIES: DUF1003 domain-containing protein [Acutalibacteraceae]QAT48446.1 DUF1003 domain-containing protein [Caproiciproducens sp. NJN-50]
MKKNPSKIDIIKTVMKDVEEDVGNEEMIHLILQRQFSKNTDKRVNEQLTFGQRAADAIARFAGSWTFILIFTAVILVWVGANVYFLANPYDPYPFILLNLVLSCIAAVQAPLIMMSQNRQEEKDRQRAENDYIVNLKSEIIVEDLHRKIDELLKNQKKILNGEKSGQKQTQSAKKKGDGDEA